MTAAEHRAPALVVEHLTKRFGDRVAVDDLSFSVAPGEVFGFLGPNGAGKTTTVRMLATLIAPTSGSALRRRPAARGVQNGVEIRKRIAVMTENSGPVPASDSRREPRVLRRALRLAAARRSGSGRRWRRSTSPRRANDPCGSLSKGLRQRVALARTLLNDPAIVFLDEPTSGLDPVAIPRRARADRRPARPRRHRLPRPPTGSKRQNASATGSRSSTPACARSAARTSCATGSSRRRSSSARRRPCTIPEQVFAVPGVDGWRADEHGRLCADGFSDARIAAPEVTRALVAAGADVLSLAEAQHSLEDVYLELVARRRGGAPVNVQRVRPVVRKEVREFRRNRFVIGTMAVLPFIFLITPMITIFKIPDPPRARRSEPPSA